MRTHLALNAFSARRDRLITAVSRSFACLVTGCFWGGVGLIVGASLSLADGPTRRTIDAGGFHTFHGERFWSRPLYGANRRAFVTAGELPHAAFMWFHPKEQAFVRCGHLLPGVVSSRGAKWLYQAADVTATYDPGLLRFAVRDSAWDGELRMELVPLAPHDGYAVRFTAERPVELALAFGGFLPVPDKDVYQGSLEFPGGIVAEMSRKCDYASSRDDVAVASLAHVADSTGKLLRDGLKVALLADRKMQTSLHEATSGISLPELLKASAKASPIQVHRITLQAGESLNLVVVIPNQGQLDSGVGPFRGKTSETFDRCRRRVQEISHRVKLDTPDTLVDLGARSLCNSMDALWYPPVFMHGPIRWGFPGLTGWRMAYGADVCGTYDRTASHCQYYGDHRYTGGLDGKPHLDPATALTRQAADSAVFSQGGIVSFGMYDMTPMWLSFVAHHYDWTGDKEFLRAMWPAIRDAVAYEKRVFDADGDSLYENYADTYITDGHWHNGGDCTQASAYMYRGNLLAAEAARLVGQSPQAYMAEAKRILAALNRVLWIQEQGIFAEWKDLLGQKLRHPDPELASIYLPIDNGVTDPFQTYQLLRFTEYGLPNYSFEERGPQPFDGYYRSGATYEFPQPIRAREVKSSNWRPAILTVSESSPGEQMDTARAYYKLGLNDRAFPLVKAVLRCMVNLTVPGGLVIRAQNSETPARSWANNDVDHCDTLGPSLQCIAEGIFGIHPHMPEGLVEIQPGFPSGWDHASIQLRDIGYSFRRQGNTDVFSVQTSRDVTTRLRLVLRGDGVTVTVNGRSVTPRILPSICHPFVEVDSPKGKTAALAVTHDSQPLPSVDYAQTVALGRSVEAVCRGGAIVELKDPQKIFQNARCGGDRFSAEVRGQQGHHTAFVRVQGKNVDFWTPLDVEIRPPLEIVDAKLSGDTRSLSFALRNNAGQTESVRGEVRLGGQSLPVAVEIGAGRTSQPLVLHLERASHLVPGLNPLTLAVNNRTVFETRLACWNVLRLAPDRKTAMRFEPIDISAHFNDDLALVHTHSYRTPRSPYCSLGISDDLFRDWCHASEPPCGKLDLGILKTAAAKNAGLFATELSVPFKTTSDGKNIIFVSQWNNYPKRVMIPVGRSASHAYLLMASVTNPMQSGVVNGRVVFHSADGVNETLELVNPTNLSWCVDHYPGRYAPLGLVQPTVRLGEHTHATVYSVPLDASRPIESITVESVCNESVIGLMGITLCPANDTRRRTP